MIVVRLALFATALFLAASCGGGERRDQWYGTDVGVGWDAGVLTGTHDSAPGPDMALDASGEAGPDGAADVPAAEPDVVSVPAVQPDAGAAADVAASSDTGGAG
jgi:hypothetical protein